MVTANESRDKKLKISELWYRRLFETAQDGILLVDFDSGMILDVNKFLIDMLSYTKKDFLKKHLWEVGAFKDIAASKKNFSILQNKKYIRFEDLPLETKTGDKVDVEFVSNVYQVGGVKVIQCNIRNIMDRKKIEYLASETLRQSEEKFSKAFQTSPYAITINRMEDGSFVEVNDAFILLTGFSLKETLANSSIGLKLWVNEKDRQQMVEDLRNGKKVVSREYLFRMKNGEIMTGLFSAQVLKLSHGLCLLSSILDITDRKKNEQEIMKSKAKSDAILSSIGDAVFACDKEGNILLFNKMAEELTGISAKDAIGHHYSKIITFIRESDGKPSNDFVYEAIKSNKITKMTNHVLLFRKDKGKIPVADSAAPITDAKGNIIGCVVVFHDVTHERQIDKAKTEFVSLA